MPGWIQRYKESVALSQDDFKIVEALTIAWEAHVENLNRIKKEGWYEGDELDHMRITIEDSLRRIEELGNSKGDKAP